MIDASSVPGVRPGVLVTEASERGPLAACRSLDRAGYAVAAVAETRLAAGHWSRSCDSRLVLPDVKEDPKAFVAELAELAGRRQYAALVPGGEASLVAISEHGRNLEDLVRIGLPADEVVDRSLDKVLLLREGEAVGMPPPASIVCTSSEASGASQELGYPVALKPVRSILFASGRGRQKGTAVATNAAEAESAAWELGSPLIVQRFERGAERLSCAGVRAEGELLGLAVARYERTWPPLAGAASFAKTVRPPEDLVTATRALLGRIGWEGIFELEVLVLAGGRLAVMDLNPRLFGWLALAVGAGADLPAIWCDFLLGRKRSPAVARAGIAYRWEEAEVCNFVSLSRRGEPRGAAAILMPHRRVVHAHFRWRDPVPLLARFADLAARTARRLRQRGYPPLAVSRSAVPRPSTVSAGNPRVRHRSRVVGPAKAGLARARSVRWLLRRGTVARPDGLRILCYHRVSDEPDDLAVSPRRFREQMEYLRAEGYRVLDVVEAFRLLDNGELPPRTIALTFDDGYRDVAEHALPVLAEHGFGATVFVVTGAADGTALFSWYRHQPPLLGWDEILQLDQGGLLRFEAHSVTHPTLVTLSAEAASDEIRGSKQTLEERLGRPVEGFCYPGGVFTPREEKLAAEAGFRLAVSVKPGLNVPRSNRFALFRQTIEPRDNLLDFRAKIGGGHDSFLLVQRVYRSIRHPQEALL